MNKFYTLISGLFMFVCLIFTSNAQTDTIPPIVLDFHTEFSPDELSDSVDAAFTITYSEEVQLADTFTIVTHSFNNGVWEEFGRYDTTEIAVEKNVITVTPKHSFWASGRYEFIVTFGSVMDSAGNMAGSFARTFVADEDAPEVVDHSIELVNNGLNDSVSAVFTLNYSEDIHLVDTFQVVTHIIRGDTWDTYDTYDASEVVVNGNTLTISPAGLFSSTDRYELVVTFGSVSDLAGNLATSFTRIFVVDVIPPEVEALNTEFIDTEFSDSVEVVFTLTYNEDVKLAPTYQFVTHYRNAGIWENYEIIADTGIVVVGNTITLYPTLRYSTADSYELVVASGSVRDLVDNQAGSFTNVFLLDTIPPKLIDISPNLDLLVPADANFTMTFDENVRLANNFGFYTYYWNDDSAKYIQSERLTASQVTVDENVVTFNPALSFMPATRSQIILTAGSVLDMEGNRFLNVTGEDTLTYVSERFWTADSGVTVVSFIPADGDSISFIPDALTITFSEKIMPADTAAVDSSNISAYVYLRQNGLDIEHVAVLDSLSKMIIVEPFMELSYGTTYTYGFTDGLINESGDSISAMEATFTILDSLDTINDYAIAEINGDGETSPYLGQVVRITGTITGIYTDEGFFIQDDNSAGSGIWVQYSEVGWFEVGAGVTIVGTVEVINGVTAMTTQEVYSVDPPLTIEPIGVSINSDSIPMYRNVLVQITNARASAADEEGEWIAYTQDDADSVAVGNKMFTYTPVENTSYHITGVVSGWDSIYRIEPRAEADVMEAGDNFYAISEIHGDSITSPLLGQEVRVNGTVTAVYSGEGFYIQDENAAGSGIWVQYTDTLELQVGDGADVTGVVEQADGVTSIAAGEVTAINAPITVEPVEINFGTDSIPMYHGVLVQIVNARASAADTAGEWNLFADEDADSIIIGNRFYAYMPVLDNLYNLAGVVTFRDSIYRIEPRFETDIVDVTDPTSAGLTPDIDYNIYPNPFGSFIKISNNDRLTRVIISNITGQRVMDIKYPEAEIKTSHLISGVYIINLFNENNLVKTSRIIKR